MRCRSKRWQRERIVVGQLVHLGRGEDEFHVRGRFLERLEQRVERRAGEHVHLVDDVDLVAALGRGVADVVAQVAHLLDAVVGGAVDFEHVEAAALGDLDADFLLRDRTRRWAPLPPRAPWPGCARWRFCPCRAARRRDRPARCGRAAARWSACARPVPGRRSRRTSGAGICARKPGKP